MTILKITYEEYGNLPQWVSLWVFNWAIEYPQITLSDTNSTKLEKMLSYGFVAFDKIEVDIGYGYVITFNTKENKLKFMMEFL